ncbi:transposase [Nocardia beijingensis]|uniref:transposase n=1 Tax=Nocardia beijingensis TaxID=95162 RepID=UPI0033CAF769
MARACPAMQGFLRITRICWTNQRTMRSAGRVLSLRLTPGHAGDSPLLAQVLDGIVVPRLDSGAPRRTPEHVIADKAYSSAANRNLLRSKRISIVIPERSDQKANRKRRGSLGGRTPKLDRTAYKSRNVVERAFSRIKQWRAIATRYDKLALAYRAGLLLALITEWLRLLGGRQTIRRAASHSDNSNRQPGVSHAQANLDRGSPNLEVAHVQIQNSCTPLGVR